MPWSIAVPVATAVIGGAMSDKGGGTTTQNQMDPDARRYVYGEDGKGGLLGAVSALSAQQAAQGGLNPLQRAGMEAQRQVLTSPGYTPGLDQMRQVGMGLMGAGAAANPFSTGQVSLGGTGLGASYLGSGGVSPARGGGARMLGANNTPYVPISITPNSTYEAALQQFPVAPPPAPAAAPAESTDSRTPEERALDDWLMNYRQAQIDAGNSGGM